MRTTRVARRAGALAVGLACLMSLAACGGEAEAEKPDGATTAQATDEFPVTVEHQFGKTVIENAPKRVATWGWGSTEAAIAAGVFPVAVGEQVWTVGKGKLLPWVEQAYDAADVAHPTVLPDPEAGATVPYADFIKARPDLIVAPYSGLTEEQYKTLSNIAPVVAPADGPWTTSWDDTIRVTAKALGRTEAGEEVLDEIDHYLEDEAAEHPEFEGKTLAGIWAAPTGLSVYTARDPRVGILTRLGFEIAPSVDELDTSKGGFYYDLTWEKADELTSDVVVSYHNTDEEAAALAKDRRALAVPAVKAGHVAQVVGPVNVSAVSPPTALSFTWEQGMPALIDELAEAVKP